jgi:hypothetical protein
LSPSLEAGLPRHDQRLEAATDRLWQLALKLLARSLEEHLHDRVRRPIIQKLMRIRDIADVIPPSPRHRIAAGPYRELRESFEHRPFLHNELVKLIRKLRWMGSEREAEKVEDQLTLRKAQADSVIAASHETD